MASSSRTNLVQSCRDNNHHQLQAELLRFGLERTDLRRWDSQTPPPGWGDYRTLDEWADFVQDYQRLVSRHETLNVHSWILILFMPPVIVAQFIVAATLDFPLLLWVLLVGFLPFYVLWWIAVARVHGARERDRAHIVEEILAAPYAGNSRLDNRARLQKRETYQMDPPLNPNATTTDPSIHVTSLRKTEFLALIVIASQEDDSSTNVETMHHAQTGDVAGAAPESIRAKE